MAQWKFFVIICDFINMSIFFNFDVGPTGRRFRRAVDGDKADIEHILKKNNNEKLFGEVNIGSLIELCTLSICMIDENKAVTGFVALDDHPNVPGVSQADWENWIRNMFQKYFLARNTLFIHYMCCIDEVVDYFLEEAIISVFNEDVYMYNILFMVPYGCPEELVSRLMVSKKHNIYKHWAKKDARNQKNSYTISANCSFMYNATRHDFCPKLKIRRAVEEDNDEIVTLLDQKCPRLRQIYGDYYASEIIGRHPDIKRKIIVADNQDHVVGVMCMNADINYENLQSIYELEPYYGLRKATPLEKEHIKRSNTLLKTFGDPILHGRWGPYDRTTKAKQNIVQDILSNENLPEPRSVKTSSKVIFRHTSLTENSFDRVYFKKEISDDYSAKFYETSPTLSVVSTVSMANLLEEDPFDYEIVNIDTKLLTVPRVISFDFEPITPQTARQSRIIELERKLKRRSSLFKPLKHEEHNKVKYSGEPNAFIIELFGLREDVDYRQAFDFLEASFEAMKDYDYCIIRVPCSEKSFPLLQHFCFVPTKTYICSKYSLYIAHKSSVLGKLRVRKAELIDVPMIAQLMNTIDVKETMWTVESTIHKKDERMFVLVSGSSLVGLGILERAEQIDFIQTKYNLDSYHIQKYHYQSQGIFSGFSALKTVLIYPVFEVHFRFFAREMMRLSECTTLVWLTAYRNKWAAHKANTLAVAMIPLIPRKSEVDCASVPEVKKVNMISNSLEAFSTWFISKKFTTLPRMNIDNRIVIVGASRTTMAFLNALLFGDSCTYLTFTNVTLISPNGLPYVRHSKVLVESMFLKRRTNTDKYLKSIPFTYYVNVIQGTMSEIDRRQKYVILTNGNKYHYDLLFLLFGKQYQHPNYMNAILEREEKIKFGQLPYIRLDVPKRTEEKFANMYLPENVFIINNLSDANKALKYINNKLLVFDSYSILVYGATIHAYCCVSTLLQMGVTNKNIVFIEPFPLENPKEPRVSVFANVYVDETVNNMMESLKIKIYRSHYFQSWICDSDNLATTVNIMSQFKMVQLHCSALFYYGKQGVDEAAFVALNKSGIAYNDGILIDHEFRTRDPAIYSAGPATRYNSNYYADDKQQMHYDSYEIGTKLGNQTRNQLDPFFDHNNNCDGTASTTSTNDTDAQTDSEDSKESTSVSSVVLENNFKKLPDLKQPSVMYCVLPGGLQYLEVRSPGKKTPCYYIQSLHYNGEVIETFKEGYFKLHINKSSIVDGITCLTPLKRPLDNFANLYGQSTVMLNNVLLRYTANKLDDLYAFFRSPWAYFLYHDKSDELLAMVKELLPKGQRKGETFKEALYAIGEKLRTTSCTETMKLEMRSSFATSPHVEAITDYVIDWLSENEALLPVFMQPWHQAEYSHDVDSNPAFRKRKRSIINMLNAIY